MTPEIEPHQCIARKVYAPAGGTALDVAALQKCNSRVFATLAYPFMLRFPKDAGGRIDPRLSVATRPLTVNVWSLQDWAGTADGVTVPVV